MFQQLARHVGILRPEDIQTQILLLWLADCSVDQAR
jgi:hypothetical protein